jgi:hypothetical protein
MDVLMGVLVEMSVRALRSFALAATHALQVLKELFRLQVDCLAHAGRACLDRGCLDRSVFENLDAFENESMVVTSLIRATCVRPFPSTSSRSGWPRPSKPRQWFDLVSEVGSRPATAVATTRR